MKLSEKNPDERDKLISFKEEGHSYTIHSDPNTKYTSVTTWIHQHFKKFDADEVLNKMRRSTKDNKYPNMTDNDIKQKWNENAKLQSKLGTALHQNIENYYNEEKLMDEVVNTVEWQYFLNFVNNYQLPNKLSPYRTEKFVFNEDIKLCGSIDCLFELENGNLVIYDWKRVNEIKYEGFKGCSAITDCISDMPDTNFWHYSLQLNMYKYILESKYNKIVEELALVVLHPNNSDYQIIKLPVLENEINKLVALIVNKD
jgi:hypothetical protein